MSLFENDHYRWRETYFVLFDDSHRPTSKAVKETLQKLGDRYQITEVRSDSKGRFESLTLLCPYDYAAMDVSYVAGEDVLAHIEELREELRSSHPTGDEKAKFDRLATFNARLDIYHFAQVVEGDIDGGDDDDEFLDPGALLVVLERLAKLCHGLGVDPQSGTLM